MASDVKIDDLRDFLKDKKIPITIEIQDLQKRVNGVSTKVPYKSFNVKEIEVFIDNLNSKTNTTQYTDSISFDSISIFSKGKLKYHPESITSGIAIKKNQSYSPSPKKKHLAILKKS